MRRFFLSPELQPLRRDETEIKTEHQDEKEHDGKSDTHGKRLDGALGLAFVLDKVIERGAKAEEDDCDEKKDDDSHAGFLGEKFSLDDSPLCCQ